MNQRKTFFFFFNKKYRRRNFDQQSSPKTVRLKFVFGEKKLLIEKINYFRQIRISRITRLIYLASRNNGLNISYYENKLLNKNSHDFVHK